MSNKRAVNNAEPRHFRNHIFEKTFKSQYNEAQVWDWQHLNGGKKAYNTTKALGSGVTYFQKRI